MQSRSRSGVEFAQVAKHLRFFRRDVQINQKVYQRDILEAFVLPGHKSISKMQIERFSKTATAHKANKTHEWCKANFPDRISFEEWPTYTPVLNPMCGSFRSSGPALNRTKL
ncbi:hypothetical protein TNCV_4467731 [Trichonephila clavipes]|nr:hypothetical protein TNCV_4467731 [Trichonephila clavipes]